MTELPYVVTLYRYPVKGLSAQPAERVAVTVARGLDDDRRFALALGTTRFDPDHPEALDKGYFLQLRANESLAALRSVYESDSQTLTIATPTGESMSAEVATRSGCDAVADLMQAHLGMACHGRPRLVAADGHKFTDVSVTSTAMMKALSLVNLASVRDLARHVGRPVHPLRFRANIYVDGLAPWAEREWVGRAVAIGSARFSCAMETRRCAAIDVDPETGARDMVLPKALVRAYGHANMGVYLEVAGDGRCAIGDCVDVADRTDAA